MDKSLPKIDIPTGVNGKPKKPLGILWYETSDDFKKMQEGCPDFTSEDYGTWKAAAEEALQAEGQAKVSVAVNPAFFFKWCEVNAITKNNAARQRFVHDLVEAAFEDTLKAWKKSKKKK